MQNKFFTNTFKSRFIIFSTVIFAFSSLIYELIFSTLFSFLFGSTIEMYSLVIGFYLFALGLGSYFFYFFQKTKKITYYIDFLFYTEFSLILFSLLGFFTIIFFYGVFNDLVLKLIGFIFVIIIGFLSGIELPLLSNIYEKLEKEKGFSKILSFDYFGSLIAGVLFPLLLYPQLGILGTLLLALTLNSFMTLLILFLFKKSLFKKIILSIVTVFLLISLMFYNKIQLSVISYLIEKMAKLNWDFDKLNLLFNKAEIEVKKVEFSKYQIIYKFLLKIDNETFFCLGLNDVTQLCSHNYVPHHYVYILPAKLFNFSLKNKKILILGGGDGITARFLLNEGANAKNIFQLELDKKVVEFVNKDLDFLSLNQNSLKKIKIIYGDAFLELRRLNQKFDLILDDIDISNWENKIKFTSLEYYSLLNKSLNEDGVLVLTTLNITERFPIDKKTLLILNNLYLAGFRYVLPVKVSSLAYSNDKNDMVSYEDVLLVTKKKLNFNNTLIFDFFDNKFVTIEIKDKNMVNIKKVLNFYYKYYSKVNPKILKKNFSSIFLPDYSLLNI
jgi:spermidine synthase